VAAGVPYALLTLVCFAINDLLFKRAAQAGAASHQVMTALTLTMLPCFVGYGLVTQSVVPTAPALWGSVGAVFAYVGFYNFSRSLQSGAVSIAAPVFRLQFVVTAVLALALLGERLSSAKVFGLCLATAAVWLLLAGGGRAAIEMPREGVVRLLAATVALGVAFFLFKLALREGATPATVLICQITMLSSLSVLCAIVIDRGFTVSRAALRYGVPFGVSQAIGFAALIEALSVGEASVLVPIAQLSFVLTALVGLAAMNETVTLRKTVGLLAAVGAVGFLALAARQ
jgi:uncharacterized membrane protein